MSTVTNTLIEQSEAIAREALARYDFSPRATMRLANLSENVTFKIDDPATGERAALRLHRQGYHERHQIKSELLWLDALRADRCVEVPPPIAAKNGERVVMIDTDDGPRMVTVNGWMDGVMPDEHTDLVGSFGTLGAATAKLHAHATAWELPDGFCRPTWGVEQFLGPHPTFGPWRAGLGLDAHSGRLLEMAEAKVLAELATFPTTPDHWGLIHADLRLTNLLLHDRGGEQVVRVIDFDDCGKGWLMYDFGAAVSFMEHDPRLPELLASWVDGYRGVRPLGDAQHAQLATFVMLRRLVLVGWVARNVETATEASILGAGFTDGACEVAERYLDGTLTG